VSEASREVLSREEIDAILVSASEGAQGEESRLRRGPDAPEGADFARTPVARALRDFADEHSRQLATLYQRSIALVLTDLRSLPAGDFAAAMIDHDSPLLLRFEPSDQGAGALLLGRTLLYGWLTLGFGGQIDLSIPTVPERRLTSIEARFLAAAANEIVRQLETSLSTLTAARVRLGPVVEPQLLPSQTAPRLLVASFDAGGFGNVARLRIALPEGLFQADMPSRRRPPAASSGSRELAERLHAMPLALRAEVGSAEIPVARLRALHAGDVVPLRPACRGDVLVRIEGEPRFGAVTGSVGKQLAIKITERM